MTVMLQALCSDNVMHLHVCDNVISKGNVVISEWGGGGGIWNTHYFG